jgi:hypothetical protein
MSNCKGTILGKRTGCFLMYKAVLDADALGSCESTYAGCSSSVIWN